MMTNENLIALVYSKPEIWDQSNHLYTIKEKKVKAWSYIAEKLSISADVAKGRWTNLRDLFRRELKKTLRVARNTGDPEAYVPRWKHFKSMLFLKEQIVKDEDLELPSLTFDDTFYAYPQTILDDGGSSARTEEESFEDECSPSSTPTSHMVVEQEMSRKRNGDSAGPSYDFRGQRTGKKQRRDDLGDVAEFVDDYSQFVSSSYNEMDEDYHFVMSILPSLRRIRPDRKTSFKMKVLQLIMEEECCPVD